ncbi:MAG: small subunit ribosomal protein [Candidatus Peribacteria bacterium]|nr:small subunit ribosomal protein [Candidatus Peribacteria bacterium]
MHLEAWQVFFCLVSPVPMALKRSKKKKIIGEHRKHETDTGSPQVQIAILTQEISLLTEHLQAHKKDHSARKGLLTKVADRRKQLKYLEMNKPTEYQDVLTALGLKK